MARTRTGAALALAAIGSLAGHAAHGASGNTATRSGVTAATVITPIRLLHDNDNALNFGTFTTGSGGTVVVTPTGAGSTTGAVTFVRGIATPRADRFQVSAQPNSSFSIVTGSGTVRYKTTTLRFTTTPSASSGRTTANGSARFTVGGTLVVPAGIAPGVYTGTYPATVAYN